jgi:hypothetical protein
VERRGATRYQLRVPVVFRCTDGDVESPSGCGFTRDVSTKGVFIICDTPPPPRCNVELEVFLTPFAPETSGLRVKGSGLVLRVDQTRDGFAVMSALEFAGAWCETVPSASSKTSVQG